MQTTNLNHVCKKKVLYAVTNLLQGYTNDTNRPMIKSPISNGSVMCRMANSLIVCFLGNFYSGKTELHWMCLFLLINCSYSYPLFGCRLAGSLAQWRAMCPLFDVLREHEISYSWIFHSHLIFGWLQLTFQTGHRFATVFNV